MPPDNPVPAPEAEPSPLLGYADKTLAEQARALWDAYNISYASTLGDWGPVESQTVDQFAEAVGSETRSGRSWKLYRVTSLVSAVTVRLRNIYVYDDLGNRVRVTDVLGGVNLAWLTKLQLQIKCSACRSNREPSPGCTLCFICVSCYDQAEDSNRSHRHCGHDDCSRVANSARGSCSVCPEEFAARCSSHRACDHHTCLVCSSPGMVCYICERCDRCKACACGDTLCVHCPSVGKPGTSSMTPDGYCGSCTFNQRWCAVCAVWHLSSEGCPGCGRCIAGCNCPAIRVRSTGSFDTIWLPVERDKINLLPQTIGIEIELADAKRADGEPVNVLLRKWGGCSMSDTSIHGINPIEICTGPAAGDLFLEQMKELTEALKIQKAKVNHTCGIHVHVGGNRLDYAALRRLVYIYEKAEPGLWEMLPSARRSNRFCIAVKGIYSQRVKNVLGISGISPTAMALKRSIEHATYGTESTYASEFRNQKYHSARYMAMNLHSWFYRGTIEFRHAPGTTQYPRIVNWALLCASMVNQAETMTDEQVDELPTGWDAIRALSPTPEVTDWLERRRRKFSPALYF